MGIDAHLVHRCTIKRNTSPERDAYNNAKASWTPVESAVHCRLVEDRETRATNENAQGVVTTTYSLLVLAGTDIESGDRVVDVVYEDGTTDERVFEVTGALTRRGTSARHKSATLEVIS